MAKSRLRLDERSIQDRAAWGGEGFALPLFDRAATKARTKDSPQWLHFGAGNIFRAFPAALQQRLLDQGLEQTGIVVAEGFDGEIIEKAYSPFDSLSVLVVLKADGSIEKKVIGSVVEALVAEAGSPDWLRLVEILKSPSLRMVSFTITEKGYALRSGAQLAPAVAADFKEGPAAPKSIMGKLASLCYQRFKAGALPLALVSMDNCSHNGEQLQKAVREFADAWCSAGLADSCFLSYVEDPSKLSFPWSMIDKITPRPDESVRRMLDESGLDNTEIIVTAKKTFTASFVNTEEKEYLVIEDSFPNGRPALEKAGVIFTNRETVEMVEKMKVSTCLNPLHTSLAIFGCLLGFTSIHNEMRDPGLLRLVEKVGYAEGLPVVVDPGIMDPRQFIRDVLEVRLPNPFMPDTPQRIASDTSQKIPIRFGETLKSYLAGDKAKLHTLEAIPLVLAAWLRYLIGVDDAGKTFEISPDPRLKELKEKLSGIQLGSAGPFHARLEPLLSDASLFGVNLYEAGIGDKVEGIFARLIAGPGEVRAALQGLQP